MAGGVVGALGDGLLEGVDGELEPDGAEALEAGAGVAAQVGAVGEQVDDRAVGAGGLRRATGGLVDLAEREERLKIGRCARIGAGEMAVERVQNGDAHAGFDAAEAQQRLAESIEGRIGVGGLAQAQGVPAAAHAPHGHLLVPAAGGELLAWMDRACNAVGADWTGLELATSYVAGVHFDGHAVAGPTFEVTARLIHTASHSLHFGAQVNGAARAVLVLGARDDNGVARPVRQWLPGSDDGRRCRNDARRLVEMRQFVEPFSSRPSATRPTEDDPWIARGRSA